MFLSIFAATCRPHNILGFLDNLAQTACDPSSFEVLLKIDEDDHELATIIENYRKASPFTIKYLATPKLDGYYSLDVGYNELLKIANPNTYFCWLLTDEIRFSSQGWDKVLKKYIGFFSDDIFRIKLSIFQAKNYIDFFECLPCPDNYAVITRKWLEITEGWGQFWGPDSWHQCIDYYLSLCKNAQNPYGIWRSFPIFDIQIQGQEAGQGIADEKALRERSLRIFKGWQKHSTYQAQENFYRLAQRLNAHICAVYNQQTQYILKEDYDSKLLTLYDVNKKIILQKSSYKLRKFKINLLIGHKKINFWHYFPQFYFVAKQIQAFLRKKEVLRRWRAIMNYSSPFIFIKKIFMPANESSTIYFFDGKQFKKNN